MGSVAFGEGYRPYRRNTDLEVYLCRAAIALDIILRILVASYGTLGVRIFVTVRDLLDPYLWIRILRPSDIFPRKSGGYFRGYQDFAPNT